MNPKCGACPIGGECRSYPFLCEKMAAAPLDYRSILDQVNGNAIGQDEPQPAAEADPWLPLIRACEDYNPGCCANPAPWCTRFELSPSREQCIECLTGRGIVP